MGSEDFRHARIKYFEWEPLHLKEKPYEVLFDIPANSVDTRASNFSFKESNVDEIIHDARGHEHSFHLDVHGFEFHRSPTNFAQWDDKEAIERVYLPEMELFVRTMLADADHVYTYDWRMRDSTKCFPRVVNLKNSMDALMPATQAHVDCSSRGAKTMIQVHMQGEAEKLMKKPYRLINVWRPLETVKNWPLALCDARTVRSADLVTADRVRREFVGEGLWVSPSPHYEWHYLSNQSPDEIVIFKIEDSRDDIAKRCVHTSVSMGPTSEGIARRSIEMRILVFTNA